MTIGELARQVGLRTSALRYYEAQGVLPSPARVAGRRDYGPSAVNQLNLLLAVQRAGFTLAEARSLLQTITGARRPSPSWREQAERKLAEIDAKIAQLQGARTSLADAIDCACAGRADACTLLRRPSTVAAGGRPKGSVRSRGKR